MMILAFEREENIVGEGENYLCMKDCVMNGIMLKEVLNPTLS